MSDNDGIQTHTINNHRVESCKTTAGAFLIRTPDIYPVNARNWHGPYHSLEAALADFAACIAPDRITCAALETAKRQGYYSEINGVPLTLACCRWTGATKLRPFVLVDGIDNAAHDHAARAILDTTRSDEKNATPQVFA